jgi:hypothetical protein
MSDIVGNTICADLLDYLVRDGQRLKLDIRNNPRLQRYLVVRPQTSHTFDAIDGIDRSRLRLTISAVYRNGLPRRDTVSDLLDLMRERYRFAEVVYYHPKKCAFSSMLASAIERSPSAPRDTGGIYPAPWSPVPTPSDDRPHIAHLGDEALLSYLASPSATDPQSQAAARLARGIIYREEFRLLFTLDHDAATEGGGPMKIFDDLRRRDGRIKFEDKFADMVRRSELSGVVDDERPVLIYCPTVRMQAKEVAAHAELAPGKVLTLNRQQNDPMLAEEIRILNQKYQRLWRLYLFVNPRIEMAARHANRREDASMLFGSIIDVFCDHFGIGQESRVRGARLPYRSLIERVELRWKRWQNKRLPELPAEADQRIHDIVTDPVFWRTVLLGTVSVPVSEDDFKRGFTHAAAIAAADGRTKRQREDWTEKFRTISGTEWYTQRDVPSREAERNGVIALLAEAAESYLAPSASSSRRRGQGDWRSFADNVSGVLRRA